MAQNIIRAVNEANTKVVLLMPDLNPNEIRLPENIFWIAEKPV